MAPVTCRAPRRPL